MFRIKLTSEYQELNLPVPNFAYGESACLDLYNAGPDTWVGPKAHHFQDHSKPLLIPTGLHIILPPNMVALVKERGSITKTPLVLRAGVIDPGYTGEIFVNMINVGSDNFVIRQGQKLPVQLLVTKFESEFEIIDENTFEELTTNSIRKEGKIGSSDNR